MSCYYKEGLLISYPPRHCATAIQLQPFRVPFSPWSGSATTPTQHATRLQDVFLCIAGEPIAIGWPRHSLHFLPLKSHVRSRAQVEMGFPSLASCRRRRGPTRYHPRRGGRVQQGGTQAQPQPHAHAHALATDQTTWYDLHARGSLVRWCNVAHANLASLAL